MKMQRIGSCVEFHLSRMLPLAAALALTAGTGHAAGDTTKADSEIRASAQAFTEAFNRGDAKAVAAMWTTDGSLVDESGMVLKGRSEIEQAYGDFFTRNKGRKIETGVLSVELPVNGVAIEDGISTSTAQSGVPVSVGRYTAVHVLKDGKWLMTSVREAAMAQPSGVTPLAELDWLIGSWQAKAADAVIRAKFEWMMDGKFIRRDSSVEEKGATKPLGVQIIGWDAQAEAIRSWSFDPAGGHGAGMWKPSPTGWIIESEGALANGTPTSSVDSLIRVPGEDRVLGWRSANRMAGDEPLPDLPEVVFDRVAEKR
jgi:uncharacterized protein (TIGR02246 family)